MGVAALWLFKSPRGSATVLPSTRQILNASFVSIFSDIFYCCLCHYKTQLRLLHILYCVTSRCSLEDTDIAVENRGRHQSNRCFSRRFVHRCFLKNAGTANVLIIVASNDNYSEMITIIISAAIGE